MNKKLQNLLSNLSNILSSIFVAIFGAMGGAENSNKLFRRLLIPLIFTGIAYVHLENIYVLSIMLLSAVFSLGYGVPDASDEGSDLARFYAKLIKYDRFNFNNQQHNLLNMLVRGTIGALIGICFISIPILTHRWAMYFIGVLAIVLIYALLSWRNLKTYKLFNRTLSWSETLTYGLVDIVFILILKLKL